MEVLFLLFIEYCDQEYIYIFFFGGWGVSHTVDLPPLITLFTY